MINRPIEDELNELVYLSFKGDADVYSATLFRNGKLDSIRGLKEMGDHYWKSTVRMNMYIIAARRKIWTGAFFHGAELGKDAQELEDELP